MEPKIIIIAIVIIVAVFLLLFGKRIRAHYGSLKPSADVATEFEQYRENPDLTYYTSGPDLYPTALMGIDKAVTLDSKLWKKRTFKEGEFKTLIQGMQQKVSQLNLHLHGFAVVDKEGKRIGNWYSVLGLHIVIKTMAPGRVSITTPPNDMYERREGGN